MSVEESSRSLQLVVSLANDGELEAAARAAQAIQDKDSAAEAWRLLCLANANLQRFDAARYAIENALLHRPGDANLRFERALLLETGGLPTEALEEFSDLARGPQASPRFAWHLARSLEFSGRAEEARSSLVQALDRWPTDGSLHALLAELEWSLGAGAALTARLEQAIEAHPAELKLRLIAADALRNAGFTERALTLLQEGLRLAPDSPAFLTSIGVVLDSLNRPGEALPYLQRAATVSPASLPARRNLIPTLLRVRQPRAALELCEALLSQLPDDQHLIAWRATCLRALGDPEYSRLHDYARLVRSYRLRTSRAGGIAEFNAEFARECTALHRSQRRPLAQSLRGGTQTERNLPADNPAFAEFFTMLSEPVRDYIERLATLDPAHPTARRARGAGAFRISGSWSVQLQPGGFHVNHVHPAGWLSSAYYIELPPAAGDASRAGWLAFGEPGIAVDGLTADHFVRPEPGMLVLFPSYLWHGTVPFNEGGRRLTAAFDVLPA
jgi:tetratricopeptide (TPR) repeat protein